MSESPKFWDRVADKYAKQPVADEAAYQKKLAETRGYLRPDWKLLELGCGTGSTAITHAPFVKHIHAVDFSTKMIEIAKAKAAAEDINNIEFEVAGLDAFNAPDASFDAVLALSFLHLVDDRDRAIAKIKKMIKPGGFLITSTVCVGDTMKWFKYILPIGHFFRAIPLVRVFTKEDLEQSLFDAGFEIDYNWQPAKGKAVFVVAKKVS